MLKKISDLKFVQTANFYPISDDFDKFSQSQTSIRFENILFEEPDQKFLR